MCFVPRFATTPLSANVTPLQSSTRMIFAEKRHQIFVIDAIEVKLRASCLAPLKFEETPFF